MSESPQSAASPHVTEERTLTYRERIEGQPGTGAAAFFQFLAVLQATGGAISALFLFKDSFPLAMGLLIGGVTSAALCYSLAIILENVIAMRLELEFQSEVTEDELETSSEAG